MGVWDSLRDYVLEPAFEVVVEAVEGTGRAIDSIVTTAGIDGVCGGIDSAVEMISENPGKSAAVAAAALATGGAAFVFAGPIAVTAGSAGLLGSASTGTAINTLVGAALKSAALAACGGGAAAAGGGGMAGGTAVITGCGAVVGAAAGAATTAVAT